MKSRIISQINLRRMIPNNKVTVERAIDILKSGGTLGESVISDLEISKVKAMDALLLAENGFFVPDGNIVYDDNDIQYDPDFDDVEWGDPVPFRHGKNHLVQETKEEKNGAGEIVVRVTIKNNDMKEWLGLNEQKLDQIISKLLEDLYNTERLLKH